MNCSCLLLSLFVLAGKKSDYVFYVLSHIFFSGPLKKVDQLPASSESESDGASDSGRTNAGATKTEHASTPKGRSLLSSPSSPDKLVITHPQAAAAAAAAAAAGGNEGEGISLRNSSVEPSHDGVVAAVTNVSTEIRPASPSPDVVAALEAAVSAHVKSPSLGRKTAAAVPAAGSSDGAGGNVVAGGDVGRGLAGRRRNRCVCRSRRCIYVCVCIMHGYLYVLYV